MFTLIEQAADIREHANKLADADRLGFEAMMDALDFFDNLAAELAADNAKRVDAAMAEQSEFTDEQWESGLNNAHETFYDAGYRNVDPTRFAEFWEITVAGAEAVRDV